MSKLLAFTLRNLAYRHTRLSVEAKIVGASFGNDGISDGSTMTKSGESSSHCAKTLINSYGSDRKDITGWEPLRFSKMST